MNTSLFESLLHEGESTTLDFKAAQYPFANATEEEKSEILKDVIGFSNAFRRTESFILIGVKEVQGERANVIGIQSADHLHDHTLQPFVKSLTNQPIRFHYEAFGFEGKQVGILRIEDQQNRPLYLKKDYGKLRKDLVYIRRGTCTDLNKPATPEEIFQMGKGQGGQFAELSVGFSEIPKGDSIGNKHAHVTQFCEMPPRKSIPDLVPVYESHPLDRAIAALNYASDADVIMNRAYFRQLAEYIFLKELFLPVRLALANAGQVVAKNVRVEMTIPSNGDVQIAERKDFPKPPKRSSGRFDHMSLPNFRPAFLRNPGDIHIDKNKDHYRIVFDCGDLQPGRRIWPEVFYIGKRSTGDLPICGQVFADNLPSPSEFELILSVKVSEKMVSIAELKAMPEFEDG